VPAEPCSGIGSKLPVKQGPAYKEQRRSSGRTGGVKMACPWLNHRVFNQAYPERESTGQVDVGTGRAVVLAFLFAPTSMLIGPLLLHHRSMWVLISLATRAGAWRLDCSP